MWATTSRSGDQPMPPQSLPALPSGTPTAWEEAIYAFLVEKRSRSGSTRTVESYSRMLWPFFRVTTPDHVRPADVLAYAHGIGASGRLPSSTTVGARIACLSSFFRFAIRMAWGSETRIRSRGGVILVDQ